MWVCCLLLKEDVKRRFLRHPLSVLLLSMSYVSISGNSLISVGFEGSGMLLSITNDDGEGKGKQQAEDCPA